VSLIVKHIRLVQALKLLPTNESLFVVEREIVGHVALIQSPYLLPLSVGLSGNVWTRDA